MFWSRNCAEAADPAPVEGAINANPAKEMQKRSALRPPERAVWPNRNWVKFSDRQRAVHFEGRSLQGERQDHELEAMHAPASVEEGNSVVPLAPVWTLMFVWIARMSGATRLNVITTVTATASPSLRINANPFGCVVWRFLCYGYPVLCVTVGKKRLLLVSYWKSPWKEVIPIRRWSSYSKISNYAFLWR